MALEGKVTRVAGDQLLILSPDKKHVFAKEQFSSFTSLGVYPGVRRSLSSLQRSFTFPPGLGFLRDLYTQHDMRIGENSVISPFDYLGTRNLFPEYQDHPFLFIREAREPGEVPNCFFVENPFDDSIHLVIISTIYPKQELLTYHGSAYPRGGSGPPHWLRQNQQSSDPWPPLPHKNLFFTSNDYVKWQDN